MLVVSVERELPVASARASHRPRRGSVARPLSGLALVLAVSGGCGFPSPEACTLACGADGACPGGFECQSESSLCVPRGMTAACAPRAVYTNDPVPSDDAGAGLGGAGPGTGPDGTPAGGSGAGASSGGAGASGSAGTAAEAGASAGASGSGTEGELSIIAASVPPDACAGVALGGTLRASGGAAPYRWRVVQAPPGVRAWDDGGDAIALEGVPSEPGPVRVELADARGQTARAEVIVHERPEVLLDALPLLCEGENYSAELAASGGAADAYVWSVELLPGDGTPSSLDEVGLRVEGSRLKGEAVAAAGAASLRLVIDVRDAHCRSPAVELELISSAGDECPAIQLAAATVDDALPPPCRGSFYAEALAVVGGREPYVWSEVSAPAGLYFDADTATIAGIPEASGVLTVEVTDASSRTVQKSYDVELRDRCWVAFIASEPGPAHLALVDGRLIERQPELARRVLPEQPGTVGVIDFQLSPDGRFVAYRLDPSAPRLELGRLSNGRAQVIALGGDVVAYAWSDDAATLAVATVSADQSALGGLDVSTVDAMTVDPSVGLDGLRTLAPVASPAPDSALTWYGARRLAFLARDAGDLRRLVTAPTQQGRFAPAQRGDRDFSASAGLLRGAGGVFVAEPATALHEFFADDLESPRSHAEGALVAPSGAFVGLAQDGALQIFRPERASAPAAPPSFDAPGCAALLAWGGAVRERIACSDTRGGGDRITWFEISEAGDAVAELAALGDAYTYPSGEHAGRRRAFSPSGRWFAFTTRDELFVARLEPGPPRLQAVVPSSALGITASVLSFSPDESWLAVGAANSLGLIDLERSTEAFRLLTPSASFDEFCSERFVDGPGGWCGVASSETDVAWSSASDLIAFRSSLGTLQLVDLSQARRGFISAPISPDACFEGCSSSGTARFQP